MAKKRIVGGVTLLLVVLVIGAGLLSTLRRQRFPDEDSALPRGDAPASTHETAGSDPAAPAPRPGTGAAAGRGFLYGRVTTPDDEVYEGRLRFGGDEEAFWTDAFKGYKTHAQNPWAAFVPPEQLLERTPLTVLGIEILSRERQVDLSRPFMARFGDIARIEAAGRVISVTLKSGTVFALDRFNADDLMDGLRVWDRERGAVDLEERRIRSIDFLPTAALDAVPSRLAGRVRTTQGSFSGFVTWEWWKGLGGDELRGTDSADSAGASPRDAGREGERAFRFEEIRSIERAAEDGVLLTLVEGSELALSGSRQTGEGNRGVYVDDPRYGRVLVGWHAFERVDFEHSGPSEGDDGSGPAYTDFPPGQPLSGNVLTRDGRELAGRLVFDLDESETTETLDASDGRIHYTLPFGLVEAIDLGVPPGDRDGSVAVRLFRGETLRLERNGDLGPTNAGMLVFGGADSPPDYLPWSEVSRIDFEPPARMYPPGGEPNR